MHLGNNSLSLYARMLHGQSIHIMLKTHKSTQKNGNADSYWENVRAGARLPTSSSPGKHDTFLTSVWDRVGGGWRRQWRWLWLSQKEKHNFYLKYFLQQLARAGWRNLFSCRRWQVFVDAIFKCPMSHKRQDSWRRKKKKTWKGGS